MHKKSFLLLLTIFLWGGMPPTLQAQQTREAVLDSAQALHRLGDSSLQGGNWDRSVDYYHQASRLYHRLRDEHRFLLEHLYLALAFQQAGQMGNYTRYKKELTPYLQSQDTLLAQVLLSMGTAHHHADAHQEAKKYLEQALTHVQTYGPHQQSLAALIQVSLGQISREAGELELAASTLNALVHAIRSDSLSLSLEQQVRIAHLAYLVHRDQQQLSKALADARWAKEMYGRMSLEQQAKWNQVIWGDLVEVFTRLDMPDSSLHYARQQWTFTSPQSYNWSATLVQLARLQIKAQQETEAEKNLQLALGQWQQLHPGPHLRKAEIYALQGYTKAKQNEALDAAIAFQKALIAGVKGFNSEDMADYPAAETFPPLGPMLPVIWAKAEALLEYAAQTKLADHYQAALAGFELAHQLEDKLDHFGGKYGFEETWQAEARSRYAQAVACADHLHQLTGQESYARAAFLLAQQGKSRIRQAQLVRLYDRPAGDALAVARQRLGYLQEELYTLDLQISAGWDSSRLVQRELQRSALLDQIAYEQRQIKRRYPSFYDHFKGPTALDVKDFRQKLSEGEMVLQYFLAEETLYCFGLTQDEFWVDKKAWATETSGALRSFLLEVSQEDQQPSWQNFFSNTQHWSEILLPRKRLSSVNLLTIFPDVGLYTFPFALLTTETQALDSLSSFSDLAFLPKSMGLRVIVEPGAWGQPYSPREKRARMMAIFPLYPSPFFTGQAGLSTEKQEQLQEFYQTQRNQEAWKVYDVGIYQGEDTRDSLLFHRMFEAIGSDLEIVHLEAAVLLGYPTYSLAGIVWPDTSNGEPYSLPENLIWSPLRSNLLVAPNVWFSQDSLAGEVGMQAWRRTLRNAEVPSVLSGLWAQPIQAKRFIMDYFYEQLAEGIKPTEALRLAQLAYMQTHPDQAPYHWAGWTYLGPNEPMPIPRPWWSYTAVGVAGLIILLIILTLFRRRKR